MGSVREEGAKDALEERLERGSVERETFWKGRTRTANLAGQDMRKDISRGAAPQQRRSASSQAVRSKRPDGTT